MDLLFNGPLFFVWCDWTKGELRNEGSHVRCQVWESDHIVLCSFFFRLLGGQLYCMGCEKVVRFQLCDYYTCYMNMFPIFLILFSIPSPPNPMA